MRSEELDGIIEPIGVRLAVEERTEAKRLLTGNPKIKRRLTLCPNLLQNRHGFIAPNEDVISIEVARNRRPRGLSIPNGLKLTWPFVITIPQEIGDATTNLHAWKPLVELRVVHDFKQTLVGERYWDNRCGMSLTEQLSFTLSAMIDSAYLSLPQQIGDGGLRNRGLLDKLILSPIAIR